MKIIKKIWKVICFFVTNIYYLPRLKKIPKFYNVNVGIVIGDTKRKDLKDVYAISSHFDGKPHSIIHRILYFFLSKKCIFSAKCETTGKIVGVVLFYKNKRDVVEKTIHLGFIGVEPEWQRKKVATTLMTNAIDHFKNSRLDGISSRVSLDNHSSLKLHINHGFKPAEKYFDEKTNEERYYLICSLKKDFHNECK